MYCNVNLSIDEFAGLIANFYWACSWFSRIVLQKKKVFVEIAYTDKKI
jgi:hypothetical protein